jgi:hypothetical protein
MKKAILLFNLLIFSALIASSQSLSISYENGAISNGQEIWVAGDMNFPLAALLYVTNNTSSDIEVMVKKQEISLIAGSTNYFCWGLCYPPDVYVSINPLVVPANSTNHSDFSGDYDACSIIGISQIRYTFFKNNHPTDSVCVIVNFNAGYVGIGNNLNSELRVSPAYPNPATSAVKFSYNLPASEGSVVSIRFNNLLGEFINETILEKGNGLLVIPVEQYTPGIYFYSVMVDGKAVQTRKMVIK